MRFQNRVIFALTITLFLVTGSNAVVDFNATETLDQETSMQTQMEMTLSYSVHDPIVITHDDNFTTEGFTGGGTWNDPYVLDGVSITTNGYCISISHTRAVFLIENCLLTSISEQTGCGVYLNNATDGSVESSIITEKDTGVYLKSSSNNCTFINNSIYNNADSGVRNWGAYNVTLTNNTIYGHSSYGIYTTSGDCILNNNTIHDSERSGVYLDDNTYNMTLTNNTIFSNNIGITADQCGSHTFLNNTIKDNWDWGVYLQFAELCTFTNNTFENNGFSLVGFDEDGWYHNFTDNTVNGKPMGYFWNSTDIILDADLYGLVILANCTEITVRDGSITNSSVGILVGYSTNCTIANNTLYDHSLFGIRVRRSNNCTLVNNTVYSSDTGINLYDSDNCSITNNTLHSMIDKGIYLSESDCAILTNNTFSNNNKEFGLWVSGSENHTIANNTFHDNNGTGLYLSNVDNCNLTNNEFLNNGIRGIHFTGGCSNNLVYDNLIAWNTLANALDDGTANYWDDGISIGNTWSAYDGVGTYSIPGTAGSIDHYPRQADTVAPVITSYPDDFQQDEEVSFPILIWSAFDEHPYSYAILHNGTDQTPGRDYSWNGSDIEFSIESYSTLGVHNFTLIVTDTCYNMAKSTVLVTVVDITAPLISHPADIETEEYEGAIGMSWNGSDSNPTTYEILLDGSSIQDGTYTTYTIIFVYVNPPEVGTYNYTCIIYDVAGNWASDTMIFTVTPGETDTTTTTSDTDTTSTMPTGLDSQLVMILVIAGVIGVVIVVVAVIAIRRRR